MSFLEILAVVSDFAVILWVLLLSKRLDRQQKRIEKLTERMEAAEAKQLSERVLEVEHDRCTVTVRYADGSRRVQTFTSERAAHEAALARVAIARCPLLELAYVRGHR